MVKLSLKLAATTIGAASQTTHTYKICLPYPSQDITVGTYQAIIVNTQSASDAVTSVAYGIDSVQGQIGPAYASFTHDIDMEGGVLYGDSQPVNAANVDNTVKFNGAANFRAYGAAGGSENDLFGTPVNITASESNMSLLSRRWIVIGSVSALYQGKDMDIEIKAISPDV